MQNRKGMYRPGISLLCIGLMIAPSALLMGCASSGGNARPNAPVASENTYLVRTTVLLVSAGGLNNFREGQQAVDVDGKEVAVPFPGNEPEQTAFKERLGAERGVNEANSSAFVVLAAVWIAERVIDAVVKELKKRAAEYTAEYAVTKSGLLVRANGPAPDVEGIIVRRDRFKKAADGTISFDSNEMCVVYRLAEVPRGIPGSGLYDVTPIYLKITKPQARTSLTGDKIPKVTTTANIIIETVGPGGAPASPALDYSFVVTRLPVGDKGNALTSRTQINRRSSIFSLPIGANTPVGTNIRIQITEVDQGYDAKILDGLSSLLDKNKSQVVDVVKGAVGADTP